METDGELKRTYRIDISVPSVLWVRDSSLTHVLVITATGRKGNHVMDPTQPFSLANNKSYISNPVIKLHYSHSFF
jgi:hypothetical protein